MTVLFALAVAFAGLVALIMALEVVVRTYQVAAALLRLFILIAGAILATVVHVLDALADATTAAAKAALVFARRKVP